MEFCANSLQTILPDTLGILKSQLASEMALGLELAVSCTQSLAMSIPCMFLEFSASSAWFSESS
jgi:hypothetical protein